jgi:PII-like signaling protein
MECVKVQPNATLMRIYVSESRRHAGEPVSEAIVRALADASLAGVTVFKGIEGFGSHRRISSADLVDAFVDLPILLEVVDDDAKIRAFVPVLESLMDDGLVTLERIEQRLTG